MKVEKTRAIRIILLTFYRGKQIVVSCVRELFVI